MGIYFIILKTKRLNPASFLLVFYILISALMFLGVGYFTYNNKLPSLAMLGQVSQLGDVNATMSTMMNDTISYFLKDLPAILGYLILARFFIAKALANPSPKQVDNGWFKRMVAMFLLTTLGITFFATKVENFKYSYMRNEIITYLGLDIFSATSIGKNWGTAEWVIPSNKDVASEFYGVARGKNVITIQVEAMQNFVIGRFYDGQEITPNLNKLIAQDSIYFDKIFYQVGGGNTADAEFTVNNSLYSNENYAIYAKYPNNDYYSMANLLKDNGYSKALAFHGYEKGFWNRQSAYPNQGFDEFYGGVDFNAQEIIDMGISDKEFFQKATKILGKEENPFYAFMITLSSHHPYVIGENHWGLKLRDEHYETIFGDYLQAMHYVDMALGVFIDGLKASGLYDNSIITIYGDHFGLANYDEQSADFITELIGQPYDERTMFNVPLIMHMGDSNITKKISTVGGQVDIMPTMLDLLGLENTKGKMLGNNLLTIEKGIVYEQMHMGRGSYITDNVLFYYPSNGILYYARAIDMRTGEKLDVEPYIDGATIAKDILKHSDELIISNDILIKETP